MRVIGKTVQPDWPKLGPSLMIATALVVAIRTAKWAAVAIDDPHFSDVYPELDKEVGFAMRITERVLQMAVAVHPGRFPQKEHPVYEEEEEAPK